MEGFDKIESLEMLQASSTENVYYLLSIVSVVQGYQIHVHVKILKNPQMANALPSNRLHNLYLVGGHEVSHLSSELPLCIRACANRHVRPSVQLDLCFLFIVKRGINI